MKEENSILIAWNRLKSLWSHARHIKLFKFFFIAICCCCCCWCTAFIENSVLTCEFTMPFWSLFEFTIYCECLSLWHFKHIVLLAGAIDNMACVCVYACGKYLNWERAIQDKIPMELCERSSVFCKLLLIDIWFYFYFYFFFCKKGLNTCSSSSIPFLLSVFICLCVCTCVIHLTSLIINQQSEYNNLPHIWLQSQLQVHQFAPES